MNEVVDLLEGVELPPDDGRDLPATFTERIVSPAIARIRELAGSSAEVMLELAEQELTSAIRRKRDGFGRTAACLEP